MNAVTKHEETGAVHLPADPMVSMIERVAMQPDMPIERLNALMDMRERQMNKEAEQIFNAAFAAAMAEMPDVKRSGHNKHLGNRYATLDDLIRAARPVLSRHGLSLNWQSEIDGQNITVTAIVRHARGHSISTKFSGPRDNGKQMNALQGGGSTETYLKRYTGFAILGLSTGEERDDDGQASGSISEDQYRTLRDMCERIGADEEKIARVYGVDQLFAIPAINFQAALGLLRAKMQKGGAQ